MIAFALLSLPAFSVVAVGWVATRTGLANANAIDALGAFSFRFALPALVLHVIASQPLGRSFNPLFYGGYLASGGVTFVIVFTLACALDRKAVAQAGACATTATVSNLGFLGPPLTFAYLGERGAGPLAMAILAEVLVLLSVGTVVMAVSRGSSTGVGRLVVRGTLQNPVVAAIVLGGSIAATGNALPLPVNQFLVFLGGSAGPAALFALGGSLAIQRIDSVTAVSAGGIAGAKLLLYPALVWCVLALVLKIEPFWVESGVLIASLPSASSNYVIAQRYAADTERVSGAIVLSTIVSVATVPISAWLVIR